MARFNNLSQNFTMIPNWLINDQNISLKAKGLFIYLASKPNDFDFSAERIALANKEGVTSVKNCLKELELVGLLIRVRIKNDDGKFIGIEYTLNDKPSDDSTISGKPTVGFPIGGKPTDINKKEINKKENVPSSDSTIESNQLLIDQTEPESFNPLHFFIAKSYHNFFLKSKGKIRTLTKVETKSYVKTIRLMLENDGVTVEQMIAVKMFLDDSIAEGSRLDSFWANTIYSMATFREKKNDVYRWDMIKKQADEWGKIEGNVSRVSTAHKQLMEKVESYAGV